MPHVVKMKPRESHILEDRREGDGEETKPTSRSKLGAGVLPMRVWGSLTLAPLSQLRYVRASWFCETVSDNAHRTGRVIRAFLRFTPGLAMRGSEMAALVWKCGGSRDGWLGGKVLAGARSCFFFREGDPGKPLATLLGTER